MFQRPSFLFLIAVFGSLPLVLTACSEGNTANDPRMQAPLVRAGIVETSGGAERAFTGVVAARVQSDLGFRVPGKVLERMVDSGQTVTRGQSLMRIDPTDLRLVMRAQEQAVAATRALAQQSAEDEVRYRDLVAAGAVSASAYDKVKAAAESAAAQLDAAEAQAEVARNETHYAVLVADADGVVVDTLAEPGQVVAAGQIVVRVAHAGRREAIIDLPETLRPAIGSTGRATLYGSGLTGAAKLRQLSNAANRQTRTFEARYVLDGEIANAPLGSTIVIRIPATPTADSQSAVSWEVPIGAVFDPGAGAGVWLVQGNPPEVTWRGVQILRLGDDVASVRGSLMAGDRVVALGAHLLREGEHIRLAENDSGRALTSSSDARP
jgi:RND family efflux transporter MFP subunit